MLTQTFSSLLKQYNIQELLVAEMEKRNYTWRWLKKNSKWYGGQFNVPFEGGEASSVTLGGFVAANDIAETVAVSGYESNYRFIGGSMLFNNADIDLTNDAAFEQSFLKILPKKLNQFMNYMEGIFSHIMLNGAKIDTLVQNGGATGEAYVSFPERFTHGQKVIIRNNDPAAAAMYVVKIDMINKIVYLSATRGGAVANLAAYTTAKLSAIFVDGSVNTGTGAMQNEFNSIRDFLLPLSAGGSTNIHSVAKTSYAYLQAQYLDGSTITASTLLDDIFDFFYTVMRIGKGKPSEIWMSFKHFATISKYISLDQRYSKSDEAVEYGFTSAMVKGPMGSMKIVALRDMNDSEIFVLDKNAWELAGSHFFEIDKDLNGNEYTVTRNTTGKTNIVDIKLYGNLICYAACYNGVIAGISY